MARQPKRIRVTRGLEVETLLEEARTSPVILEKDGELFRLDREEASEDVWAGYDPEAALAGIRVAAGSWKDIDTEAFKTFLYRAREEGTKSPTSIC